jgi:hypothetical protein
MCSVAFVPAGGHAFRNAHARVVTGHRDGAVCIWEVVLLPAALSCSAASPARSSSPPPPNKALATCPARHICGAEVEDDEAAAEPDKFAFRLVAQLRGHQVAVTALYVAPDLESLFTGDAHGVAIQWALMDRLP